ncbi:Transcriptional adapter ada2 [Conglomerata obtusa]
MAITLFKNDKKLIILCDCCYQDITIHSRIQCIECTADFCVPCFYENFPLKKHDSSHAYKAIEPLTFVINDENWTALEELLLFEGIFANGLGNWKDVSDFVGTKGVSEVENHFYNICELQACNLLEIQKDKIPKHSNTANDNSIQNNTSCNDNQNFNNNYLPSFSNPNFHEIASYMPLRKDFDTEFENEYETIFKEMNNDVLFDNGHMKNLRDAIFDSYQNVLKLRSIKKHLVLEKDLLDMKYLQNKENEFDESENEILRNIKPIAPYLSKNDFNKFFKGLCIENALQNGNDKKLLLKDDFLEYEKKRHHLLSEQERKICNLMKLSYKEYLKIKQNVVEEKIKNGFIDYKKMKSLINCRDFKIESMYKFFKINKWI